MKKKTLIITLNDGREIKKDLADIARQLPVGTPANAPDYMALIGNVAVSGITESEGKESVKHIPASQIRTIEVRFE